MFDFDKIDDDGTELPFLNYDTPKYIFELPDANEILRDKCIDRARELFGNDVPVQIIDRLLRELQAITVNGYASYYLIAADIVKYSLDKGYPVSNRGTLSSSLVTYLCGISQINPMSAYYYCLYCHHFEFVNKKDDDVRTCVYELHDKKCPDCNRIMEKDGIDVLSEINMGVNYDKEPTFNINFAPQIRSQIVDYIKITYSKEQIFRAGTEVKQSDGTYKRGVHPGGIYIVPGGTDISSVTTLRKWEAEDDFKLWITDDDYRELDDIFKRYNILTQVELDELHDLRKETGFNFEVIPTVDNEILEVFLDTSNNFMKRFPKKVKELIDSVELTSITDLARIFGLLYGSGNWPCTEIKEHTLKEIITCRDDVMQYLLNKGIIHYAYRIMRSVSFGKGLTDEMVDLMKSADIPEWYIDSCNRKRYLYPWSQLMEYALTNWRLAYYYLHYPEEYNALQEGYEERRHRRELHHKMLTSNTVKVIDELRRV